MVDFAANLRRLMARSGLTVDDVVRRSGLDQRTVKGILAGASAKPHARTLHQLASGLAVSADELFQSPELLARRSFDRHTNPLVDDIVSQRPELFDGWAAADFDELYSNFGVGGELTSDGALATVEVMNRKREIYRKVAVLLETSEAEVLSGIVELLYERVTIKS